MTDKGKAAAIRVLRREVGFGCPVCRSPFLTWHHFDPPWHIENHWRPEGIIALCPNCHADADAKGSKAGAYSDDELRAMKRNARTLDDVKAHFPAWQDKSQLLVRVGGIYTDSMHSVISINDVPQISLSKNEAGILSLTFQLRDEHDNVLVDVEDNEFIAYPSKVHDMHVTPKTKHVKVWLRHDDVGLEFSFKRMEMFELDELLSRDKKRADEKIAEQMDQMLAGFPAEMHEQIRVSMRGDLVGASVKRWAEEHCLAGDDLIPILDFEQFALFVNGRRFMFHDGLEEFVDYSAIFGCRGAINFRC